jgi:transcription-repair coupling factor (superfamily II helicase)
MPPGRQKVDTFAVDERYRERLNAFIEKQVAAGGQVYIVCPSIEERTEDTENAGESDLALSAVSESGGSAAEEEYPLKSAVQYAEDLQIALKHIPVALMHGRMKAKDKDAVMADFSAGRAKVLVSTTVIEVGVNVPNATLMIVENAERFGLSQLHQLRGRVGRSERQAYAYFTYRPGKVLSDVARKRLQAIKQYAEFGAGFRVALCDLEIRGAGNLLGAEQHGYIDSVGYNLYVKLLNEAVLEERGEKKEEAFESNIDIKIDAHIPEFYIERSAFRMEIYKKISHVRTAEDLNDLYDELTDRFGEPPKAVERLLHVALCRAIAEQAHIPRIELRGMTLLFHTDKPDLAVWSMLLASHAGQLIGQSGPAPIIYRLKQGEEPIFALSRIMQEYYKEMNA